MNKKYLILFFIIIIIFIILFFMPNKKTAPLQTETTTKESSQKTFASAPPFTIDKNKYYTALLTTKTGTIEIALFADKTPITVNNFVYLAEKKFYNNTIFHRIIKGFMIQGGDPQGDGTGGPGYQFDDEPFEGEYIRGIIAMANSGPNTNGSQFFIIHQDASLPKNYVIFGKVIKGIEIVDKIATSEVEKNQEGEFSKPKTPMKIVSITIQEKN